MRQPKKYPLSNSFVLCQTEHQRLSIAAILVKGVLNLALPKHCENQVPQRLNGDKEKDVAVDHETDRQTLTRNCKKNWTQQ